jgi:hypothetical protein
LVSAHINWGEAMELHRVFYVVVGLIALVGVSGFLVAAIFKDENNRRISFKAGTYGLTLAGMTLMVGSMFKLFGSSELFYGLLLVVFGTGAEMLPAKRDRLSG